MSLNLSYMISALFYQSTLFNNITTVFIIKLFGWLHAIYYINVNYLHILTKVQ